MPIQYSIRSNKMMGKKEYAAQIRPAFTADIEQVVERMGRQGCAFSKAATLGVLELFFSTVEQMVLEGINVTTPLVNVHTTMTGTFIDCNDRFDRRRHRIEARVTPGRRLRRTVRIYARAEKVEGRGHPRPNPVLYHDVESDQRNSALTPGGMGILHGVRLKFEPDDPRQGVFFLSGEEATRAPYAVVNRPKQLIFAVPPLRPGAYRLEVRALAEDSTEVREGQLRHSLIVADDVLELPSERDEVVPSYQNPQR